MKNITCYYTDLELICNYRKRQKTNIKGEQTMNNLTKTELKQLVEIAEREIPALEGRGDLEQHFSDEQDFFETAVWCLKEALEAAYRMGRDSK